MLIKTFLTNKRLIPYTQGMKLTADSNLLESGVAVFGRLGRVSTMVSPDRSYELKK
jgi:hypothetical protein